jgi:hypothetical protein
MNNKPKLTIDKDGTKRWLLNGKLHRKDGPAVEYSDGDTRWALNGLYHRKDGPAVIYPDGTKYWYLKGKKHRIDGPAVILFNGDNGIKPWWINGCAYSYEEWFSLLTPEQQYNYLWKLDE